MDNQRAYGVEVTRITKTATIVDVMASTQTEAMEKAIKIAKERKAKDYIAAGQDEYMATWSTK